MDQLDALFVEHHRDLLILKVTSVMAIANELKDHGMIDQRTHSSIQMASTHGDQMTVLFNALNNDNAKSYFYKTLKTVMPQLVKKCEQQDAQFVDNYEDLLVQRVSSVLATADKLKAVKIIHEEIYSKIRAASTPQDKMRELLRALNTDKAKSAFYIWLKFVEPFLVKDLEQQGIHKETLRSAQTSPKFMELESHSQNAQLETTVKIPENKHITRWNKSSIRHKAKIEELLRETDTVRVGNLYFCKDKKYMIGSGGNGTQVYIGLTEDGIEVAIKLIMKNDKDFENELRYLQDPKLESKHIVKYVTFKEGTDLYYLANQLCEWNLEDYLKNLRVKIEKDNEDILRKIVKEMLLGLQVLHRADVIHRDIKPRNVLIGLIDKEETARLADFGISRKLEDGDTTVCTDRAGTQGWEATEIVNQTGEGHYKKSSDIQVAGMLTYYILSDGKHPFGDPISRELNISKGEYTLDDVQDIQAKDLIKWMINKDQEKRPTIDKVLDHPLFWNDRRIREVLHNLGNKEEVQEYKTYEKNKELYETVQKHTKDKSFTDWKSKAPKTWEKIKSLPNDLLGLLRYLRNALGHQEKLFYELKMVDKFPDFLISLHGLATDMGWEY